MRWDPNDKSTDMVDRNFKFERMSNSANVEPTKRLVVQKSLFNAIWFAGFAMSESMFDMRFRCPISMSMSDVVFEFRLSVPIRGATEVGGPREPRMLAPRHGFWTQAANRGGPQSGAHASHGFWLRATDF